MTTAKTIISSLLLVLGTSGATAQVSASPERFSPRAEGFLERAKAMSDAGNYAGVIDQIGHLDTMQTPLGSDEEREALFLLAEAYYMRGDEACVSLLEDFIGSYPASPNAPEAALMLGDWYFFANDWPDAVEAYNEVDASRLNQEKRTLFTYRRALSLIKTGHFKEARPLVASLAGNKDYTDAYNFYTAYLDYIDGRFNEAYPRFAKVSTGIQGLESGYYMTQIEYSRGEYADVIKHGRSLLRKNPVPELVPELQRIVGLSYFKTGEPDVAEGFLQNYLSMHDGEPDSDALYALGAIEYAHGEYDAAVAKFSQLTDLKSEVGQGAWLYLGQCYLKQDNPSSAALAFEKATRLNFDPAVSEAALYNYVTSVTRGGKVPFSSSADLLERFVREYPQSDHVSEVEGYLANAYFNDREYAKALKSIEAVRYPTTSQKQLHQKILYELGVDAVTNGRQSEAVKYLQEAARMKQQDAALAAQSSLWLGDALYSLGRYSEAQKAYEAFVSGDKSRNNLALGLYDLGYAKYKQKNWTGAAADFAKSLSTKPALTSKLADDALVRRADCLYYAGSHSEAKSLFSKIIESDSPDADYALYRRALIAGVAGDTRSKIADLSAIESKYPDSPWLSKALLELAVTYEETGKASLAADAYKKRLSIGAATDVDELLRMAHAMDEARRSADLLEVTAKIRHTGGLEADELAELSLMEARALSDLGRTGEAKAIYSSLSQTPSSAAGSEAAVALAETLVKEKDFESARNLMEDFTETGTPHQYWLARGFITLADAYHGLGETSLAREYLSTLSDNYPAGSDDIQSLISSRLKKWK